MPITARAVYGWAANVLHAVAMLGVPIKRIMLIAVLRKVVITCGCFPPSPVSNLHHSDEMIGILAPYLCDQLEELSDEDRAIVLQLTSTQFLLVRKEIQ
ncbi:MAG: hypothetical protein WKF84_16195 [Pyrinomonadaceae bacterium]